MPPLGSEKPVSSTSRLAVRIGLPILVCGALLALGAAGLPFLTRNGVAAAKTTTPAKTAPADKPAAPADNGPPLWTKQCVPSPDGQKQACYVQQFVVASPQNTVLLKVLFSYLGPDGKPRLILEAPEGIQLAAGLVLTIDTRKPLNVPLQTCQTGACRAIIDMDQQALDQFEKGTTLTVRYVTNDHKAVDLPVKLATLSTALKQLTP